MAKEKIVRDRGEKRGNVEKKKEERNQERHITLVIFFFLSSSKHNIQRFMKN